MAKTKAEWVELRNDLETESGDILAESKDNPEAMSQEKLDRITAINEELGKCDVAIKAADDRKEQLAAASRRADLRKQHDSVIDGEDTVVTDIHDKITDDPQRGYAHAGEFYNSAWNHYTGKDNAVDERLFIGAAVTGTSQGEGASLGILVPPSFSTQIWDEQNAGAENLLSQTDQFTIPGDSLTMPANGETSRATGSRYGGVRGYWVGEGQQISSSKPKVRALKLEPKELAVLVYATDKLIRNSAAAGQFITKAASDEIRFMTGDSIINGDGQGKPLGLLAAASTVEASAEAGQAATTLVAENVINMWSRMHARARQGAVWYINQEIEPQLFTMTIDSGTAGQLIYMPAGGLSGAMYGSLFGRPVVPIEYCSALGTAGDIILTNLKWYASGIKSAGIRNDASIHLRFDYNETAFRFLFEVDGQPWLASALTPFKGSNTLGAAITIATRS